MGKVSKTKRRGSSKTFDNSALIKVNMKRKLKRGFSVTNMSKNAVAGRFPFVKSSDDSSEKEFLVEDKPMDLLAQRFSRNFGSAAEKCSQSSTTKSSQDESEYDDDCDDENDEYADSSDDEYTSCKSTPVILKSSTPHGEAKRSLLENLEKSSIKMFNHHGIVFVVLNDFASVAFGGAGYMLILQGSIGLYGVRVSASENLVLPVESVPGSCILFTNRGYQGQIGNITESLDRIGAGRSHNKAKELLSRYPKKTIVAIQGRPDKFTNLKPNFSTADDSTPENSWESMGFYVIPGSSIGVPNNRRFDELVNSISKAAARDPVRVVFAGSKNSGKSSMIRALCNRFLLERIRNENQEGEPTACPILVLDLDPGQTEFTPPGCVSLVEVTETLMGPPSSHPIKPEKSYLVGGGPTPGAHPDMYVRSVELLMQHLQENASSNYILLVNTMGWLNGIGELLFGSILNIVDPTRLLSLDAEFKIPSSAWPCREICSSPAVTHLAPLQAMFTQDPYTKAVTAALHREASIIGYFNGSAIMEKHPYAIPWFKVALHEVSGVAPCQEILYLMNGNMVALCRVPERMLLKSKSKPLLPKFFVNRRKGAEEPFECLGFGIVRSVDPVNKWIHIATPEASEVFDSVNALIYNSISLPSFFYINQKTEILPYVQKAGSDLDRVNSLLVSA